MITLTPKQRREFRAQAHPLHPVVSIGQHGLTPQVMHEIDIALRAHALIKVRVFSEDRAEREAMLAQIADELEAVPVQHLGKRLILWRPLEQEPAKKSDVKPRKRRSTTKSRPAARDRAAASDRGDGSTARRRRHSTTTDAAAPARAPRGKSAPNPRRRRRT